jgi:hypothetical protein
VLSQVRYSSKPSSVLILEKPDGLVWLLLETGHCIGKLDHLVWLLLETGHCIGSDLDLITLGIVLLHCNLLWTFLHLVLRFIINRSPAPWPCLILMAPLSISRRFSFGHPLLMLLTSGCCCLRENRMVRFGILDCPIFLS